MDISEASRVGTHCLPLTVCSHSRECAGGPLPPSPHLCLSSLFRLFWAQSHRHKSEDNL